MISQNVFQRILETYSLLQILSGVICIALMLIFLLELRKYLRYQSYPDLLELSSVGTITTGLFTITGDVLLSGLAGIFALMTIATFEVRENAIWVRMMGAFTISYGFFFIMVLIGYLSTKTIPSIGFNIKNLLLSLNLSENIDINQFFIGIGYNLVLWVMVLTAFILFGRKFIVVTRFISPQMVYLVLYLLALLIILGLGSSFNLKIDMLKLDYSFKISHETKYLAIFGVNIFIYLASGPLLTILFGIKPLEDLRVEKIVSEVQERIDTPIRKIGIVKVPILNAFAYGPWFDQRIAYMATDLNQFTDAEIRGITAHELVHAKKKHTLWLLGITGFETIIKYLLEAPIGGYWEIVLQTNQTWDFLSFWIFNLILFAFLLTFVKMFEGQADKLTKKSGFGYELAESLYRLEGFYYGIAGEIGFNTQLMTGKIRSKDENTRFMGDQAFYLYKNLAPSRMTCFMNLIASHPLTTIRLVMQVDDSIGVIKAGLMVWFLLIPGLREYAIRNLQRNHQKIAELLSKKYSDDFGTINDYLDLTYEDTLPKYYLNRYILAKPWLFDGNTYWGKVTNFRITKNIVAPIEMEIEVSNNKKVMISKSNYTIVLAEPQHQYFSKKGDILILDHVEIKNGKFKKICFLKNGKKIASRSIGIDINEFQRKKYWLIYKEGIIQSWNLKDIEIGKNFKNSLFIFKDEKQDEHRFVGKELAISTPPLLQIIKTKNWSKEKLFFKLLKELEEPFILYDKDDYDIGAPCKIVSISDDTIEFIVGRTERILKHNKIDALILDYPFYCVNMKNEMGFGNILSLKILNHWGIKAKYIGI